MRPIAARTTLAVDCGEDPRRIGGSTMSTITSMFQSPAWRRTALFGFALGFVAGIIPPLVT
jgi:hypothetical protein